MKLIGGAGVAVLVTTSCLLGGCESRQGGSQARELSWQAEVEAVKLARRAGEAAGGQLEAFDALQASRDALAAALAAPQARALPEPVGRAWTATREQVELVLSRRDSVLVGTDAETDFVARMPPLAARIDEAGRVLFEAAGERAAAQNVYIVGRLQTLLERMQRRLAALREGSDSAVSAADAFARDAAIFEQSLAGLLDGNEQLGITAIGAPAARAALDEVRGGFAEARAAAQPLLETLSERLEAGEAIAEIDASVADLQHALQRARARR